MLLYGSEIWGIERLSIVEQVHVYACKRYMSLPKKTTNIAVLGDCGRYPMFIEAVKHVIKYWIRILKMREDRYVKKAYNMLMLTDQLGVRNWATYVKNILFSCGFGYV